MPDRGTEGSRAANAGDRHLPGERDAAMPLEAPSRKVHSAGPARAVPQHPARCVIRPEPVGRIAPGTDSEGKRLVVARSLSLIVRIEACEELIVEGRVESDMQNCRALAVAQTACSRATPRSRRPISAEFSKGL